MSAFRTVLYRALMLGGSVLATIAIPAVASAQSGISSFNGAPTGPVVGSASGKEAPKQAAPPALPGTRTAKTEAAPAAPGAGDLPPTEALFDAINRGDILSARDAVNRGADVSARNVLGLTPLDLSIDVGRNEITFLLLSLRPAGAGAPATTAAAAGRGDSRSGAKGAQAPSRVANASADPATPAAGRRPARVAAQDAPPAAQTAATQKPPRTPTKVATTTEPPSTPPDPAPRQYAVQRDQTGTPIPQMGFLGFGSVTR